MAFLIFQVSPQTVQEYSPTDRKAEAPERLRHSLELTQNAEAEMESAFLTAVSQKVSVEMLRQLFGLEGKLIFHGADQEEVQEWGGRLAEPSDAQRARGLCMKPGVL